MTAFLPQHDKRAKKRAKDLKSRQHDYHYNYEYVSPLAMCDDVPFRDEFSVRWLMSLGGRLMTVLRNLLDVEKYRTSKSLMKRSIAFSRASSKPRLLTLKACWKLCRRPLK